MRGRRRGEIDRGAGQHDQIDAAVFGAAVGSAGHVLGFRTGDVARFFTPVAFVLDLTACAAIRSMTSCAALAWSPARAAAVSVP